jgi:hypothetical protein
VAVFTDGYEYHADGQRSSLRTGIDAAQRLSIARSHRFNVWSLTWTDVQERLEQPGEALEPLTGAAQQALAAVLDKLDREQQRTWLRLYGGTAFDWFVHLLGAGRGAKWDVFALASWINFIHGGPQPCGDPGEIRSRLLEASLNEDWKAPGMGAAWQCRAEALDDICAFAAAKGSELQVTIRLMDERASGLSSWRASWRQFLRACNLLQFLSGSVWITTQGLREGRFGSMLDREAAQEQDDLQEFLMDVLDEKARVLVRELRVQASRS